MSESDDQLMHGFPVVYTGDIQLIIVDKKKYRMQEVDHVYIITKIE